MLCFSEHYLYKPEFRAFLYFPMVGAFVRVYNLQDVSTWQMDLRTLYQGCFISGFRFLRILEVFGYG